MNIFNNAYVLTILSVCLLVFTFACGSDDDGPSCPSNADTSSGTIGAISDVADVGNKTEGIAFDATGNLYASVIDEGNIAKITADGSVNNFATDLNRPAGIAFGPSGNLYVCEYGQIGSGGGQFTIIDTVGSVIKSYTQAGDTTLVNPNHVAVTSAGIAYMSDSTGFVAWLQNNELKIFFNAEDEVASASPNGLALNADETILYVNDLMANGGCIWKVSLDAGGSFVSVETLSTGLSNADGIALDCHGLIYVTYQLSKIATVDPVSGEITDFYTGNDFITPANIAFGHGSAYDNKSLYVAQLGLTGSPTKIKKIYIGFPGLSMANY